MFTKSKIIILSILAIALAAGGILLAGTDLIKTTSPSAEMHTLEDIYNFIDSGQAPGSHNLYPSSTPGSSMHSVSEIYVKLANLIDATKLASTSVTYLGITGTTTTTPDPVATSTKSFTATSTPDTVFTYTLDDIYNLITNNVRPTAPAHSLAPDSTPTSGTMHTLSEIYDALVTLGENMASSVTVGTAYLGQAGAYVATVTCTDFTYSDWSACVDSLQTRTIITSSPEGCTGGEPILSQGCEMPFTGTEWYSSDMPGLDKTWTIGNDYCAGLSSSGGLKPGVSWRLPTNDEFTTLWNLTHSNPPGFAPGWYYWTGTAVPGHPEGAYYVDLYNASFSGVPKTSVNLVRCAR